MVESSTAGAGGSGWYKGMVKAVSSGDCLVITLFSSTKTGPPTEKTITLSSLIAPRLARGGGVDEPFAWDSREYLRKMCVGKEVAFRVDYTLPSIGREFGSVFLGDKNVAALIVSQGWAKVREQGPQKGEVSPYLAELVRLQDQAKQQGLGCWSKVPGAAETSIRNLPPSDIGDPNNLDATGLLAANKGRSMQGIVEQVQDGSTVQAKITERFPHIYAKEAAFAENSQRSSGCCNPVKQLGPISLEHVLLALRESKEERDLRTRGLFNFFDAANLGYLDYAQIEAGLLALHVPAEYKYAKDLLKVCDANRDGRVDYHEFRRYMDDKELELYRIFQAIDVEHNGCILPEELWDALVRAGIEIDDEELARFVEHVDKDNNGIITFEEWRDFLLFYPHEATIENIYHHWERVCLVDIGEQAVIPEGISKYVHPFRYFIAGGIAGATSRTATAPLDRLKVALQVQTTQAWIMPAIKKIWKEDGLLGFFRGNGLNVVKVAPESAIKFYTYEMLKNIIASGNEDKGDIGTVGRLFAGGLAGAVAQTTIYPLDLLKTRLQTFSCEGDKVPKLGKLTKDIWVHEGPRVFYKGLVPSLLGIIPYAGIDLAAYETLKDVSKNYILQDTDPGPLIQLACGTVSGALGATCVYPLQVIRTRMQAQTSNKGAAYQGMSDVFWQTLKHEGYGGFYKGLLPNLLKVVPAASITYLVYERMKKWLELD